MRELLFNNYERERALQPYHYHLRPQPLRVHRVLSGDDWPVAHSFNHALNELQTVMDSVNDAIGHYQSSLMKDLDVGGMKTNRKEDGNLEVAIDVSQYKPEEINVKLCDDNLVIEAKTESSEHDNYHKSEFKRWIKLPQDVKHDAIKSTLTSDRKLLIEVPVNKPIEDKRSRNIPIDIQKQEAVKDGQDGQQQQNGQQQAKN